MWNTLMEWLPDLRVGIFETRDILNLLMTVVGAVLAFQAIKMGKKQGEIAKRQAAIAEKQDRVLQEQLARRSDLRLDAVTFMRANGSPGYHIVLRNIGNKTSNGVYVVLLISRTDVDLINLTIFDEYQTVEQRIRDVTWIGHSIFIEKPVFQGPTFTVAEIWKAGAIAGHAAVTIKWKVSGEDGRVPTNGFDEFALLLE